MMYMSVMGRFLINAEALNMVESIGNVTRHRKAPIIYKVGANYKVIYVPVISGESLAHAYQSLLSNISRHYYDDPPLCTFCSKEIFVKHSAKEAFGENEWETQLKNKIYVEKKGYTQEEVENSIVKNCIVEDIGGFLNPDSVVKRTSTFQVGYMVPTSDSISEVGLEAQFHVRSEPTAKREAGQMIYYVEVSSALYTFSFNIDLSSIYHTKFMDVKLIDNDKEEWLRRINIAIKSLALMIDNNLFGAKLTRFNPVRSLMSLVVSLSHPYMFNVSVPNDKNYFKETMQRRSAVINLMDGLRDKNLINVYIYDKEDLDGKDQYEGEYKVYSTVPSLFDDVIKDVSALVE